MHAWYLLYGFTFPSMVVNLLCEKRSSAKEVVAIPQFWAMVRPSKFKHMMIIGWQHMIMILPAHRTTDLQPWQLDLQPSQIWMYIIVESSSWILCVPKRLKHQRFSQVVFFERMRTHGAIQALTFFFPRTEAAPDPSRKPESRPSHRQEDAEMPGFERISQFFFFGWRFFFWGRENWMLAVELVSFF